MDAEHVLLSGPIHSADREVDHRDQAAQHRSRAHILHPHSRGRGSVMEVLSETKWTALTQETFTKDLSNRLEAEERSGALADGSRCKGTTRSLPSPPQLLDFPSRQHKSDLTAPSFGWTLTQAAGVYQSVGGRALYARAPALSKYSTHTSCSAEWQADGLSYVTSRCTVLCSPSVLAVAAEMEERRHWRRGSCFFFFLKSAFC